MGLTEKEVSHVVSALTGSDARVLMVLILLGRPMSAVGIAGLVGISRQGVGAALQHLGSLGLVQNHGDGSAGQWALTVQAKQFILGEADLMLVDGSMLGPSVKNFNTELASSSSLNHGVLNEDKPEKKATTSSGVKKLNTLDEDGETAVALLRKRGIAERLASGKGARDSVECAVAAGWSGAECLDCVEGWLEYAATPEGRKKVRSAGAMAAYQLRERVNAPAVALGVDDPRRYVTGKYADLIEH